MSKMRGSKETIGLLAAKGSWLVANVVILFWSLMLDSQKRFEEQVYVLLVQLALSFPSGLAFYLLFGVLDLGFGGRITDSMPDGWPAVLIQSTALIVVGYLQWFKLVPYLILKVNGGVKEPMGGELSEEKK